MVPYPGHGGDLVAFLGPSLWVFGNCEQGGTTVGIQPTDQDEGLFILPHFVPPLPHRSGVVPLPPVILSPVAVPTDIVP